MTMLDVMPTELITPYGESLVDLFPDPAALDDLYEYANHLPSIQLSERSLCDLELLAVGGFSPLERFMGQADYERVLGEMRLDNGYLFPIPIPLPVNPTPELRLDEDIALRDAKNNLLAIMTVEEIYAWDRQATAQAVFGTQDLLHPLVAEMHSWGKVNLSGRLQVLRLPQRHDFAELRLRPAQTRARLQAMGRSNIVAFQTRNPLHRVHEELTKRAIEEVDGLLLLHPAVGMAKPGDVDHFTRVRTYKALARKHYDRDRILLALLPVAMRLAGPREALWHALIRRNYGANHLIVGRDHASPGVDSTGKPFYGPYDAQELVTRYQDELGVTMIPFRELVYLAEEKRYEEVSHVGANASVTSISGTQVRRDYLNAGRQLPEWFTRPEVAEILADAYPPRHRQGVCIWFTGLSGAGKSTTADILTLLLLEHGRQVTVLDGDVVRTHLSQGLGFSREDRDANILRIGWVAAEIARHGGLAICAPIAPYAQTRAEVRKLVTAAGGHFIEIHVATELEVCESRDRKGLYAQARAGKITQFTGISDPYEAPETPELRFDTGDADPALQAGEILALLERRGVL